MTHLRPLTFALAAFALPTFLAACSGGSSSTGPTAATGLPKEKKLSEVTDADAQAACSNYAEPFTAAEEKNISCNFSGAFAAGLSGAKTDADAQKACQKAYDDCAAKPYTADTTDCTKAKVPDSFKTCNATVSEYDACFAERTTALRSTLASPSYCSTVTLTKTGESTGTACAALEQKCPGIFDDANP